MQTTTTPNAAAVERAVYSVNEFCDAHRITRVSFYKLLKAEQGPRIMKAGTRTLISVEAAADWRRQREEGAVLMPSRRGKGCVGRAMKTPCLHEKRAGVSEARPNHASPGIIPETIQRPRAGGAA